MDQAASRTDGLHEHHDRRWAAMAVLLIAGFMNLIDVTIVNVAIPSLQRDLGATSSGIEWVVAGYIMSFALGLLPFGRLGDTFGRRNMFLAGVGAFTLASALCGAAPTIETLVAARVLQGVSGAMMTPQTLAIAQVIFPPHERGSAFALFGLSAGFAAVTGPIVGGLLIGADLFGLGWRPIFLVNIPVGIIAMLAGLRFIPHMPGERALGIDFVGIALAALAVFLIVFPLIEGRGFEWPAWCFWMMATALPVSAFFVRWQYRQQRLERPQLLPVAVLGNGGFMIGTLVSTTFFSAIPGFFFVIAVFLQIGFGLTPIQSGLTTVPFSFGVLAASLLSTWFGARRPRQRMLVGAVFLVVSMIWLHELAWTIGDQVSGVVFLMPMAIGGLGLGTTISPLFQTVLSSVPGRDAGSASGGLQAFQQVGGAFGVAVIGEMFFSTLQESLSAGAQSHPAFIAALRFALVYPIAAFCIVAAASLVLKVPNRPPSHR